MDTTLLTGYARCSTDEQDLTAQQQALLAMGVPAERIYTDKGLTGTNRNRPGPDQALAAVRAGDTLVVPKLDRLARSVPDARAIGDSLVARGVKLRVGGIIYDPADPMGKMFFNILATFAEFEVDLLRLRTKEGDGHRQSQGQIEGQGAQAQPAPAGTSGQAAQRGQPQHPRAGRPVLRVPAHRLPRPGQSPTPHRFR
jgi:DNA invertase Pin-like site-specific DNA recombinase